VRPKPVDWTVLTLFSALVIPAAYHSATVSDHQAARFYVLTTFPQHNEDPAGLLIISRGTAILLLGVYAAYLVFQLKTHAHLFQADAVGEEEEEPVKMNVPSAAFSLLATTVVTAFCADVLVASIEETARVYHIPKAFIGLILLPIV
jgi:Ca2+:H+ antiporter